MSDGVAAADRSAAMSARLHRDTARGLKAIKRVFALEYVLQGLANPFQGITYQSFFRHFHMDYGLSEAATQSFFAQSYLAWSFKPIIGFFMDAWGRTRVALLSLLACAIAGFLLTPIVDLSAQLFFYFMFLLSVVMAATDVAVDRATVVAGADEALATGRSRASTVGLNQAICWSAIYGSAIIAALSGGWIAEHMPFHWLMVALAVVPLAVFAAVWVLPRDVAVPIPVRRSVTNFWEGLNSGPILWVAVFLFLFSFRPAMGALWTNYQIDTLHFTQTQIGISDGAQYVGLFLGVVLFAWHGVRWQEALGMKKLFKLYILIAIVINLAQYLLVDPWFSRITQGINAMLPFLDDATVRLSCLCAVTLVLSIMSGLLNLATFSLVGAVIPVAAAGSLFAGFMSIGNLAFSFSYASGAWLYANGLDIAPLRTLQEALFGIPAQAGSNLSVAMLVLIGSAAHLLSFLAVHRLPDRSHTVVGQVEGDGVGAHQHAMLPAALLRGVNHAALLSGCALFAWAWGMLGQNPISSALLSFVLIAFVRKLLLDALYIRRTRSRSTRPG
jgi:BT1 family